MQQQWHDLVGEPIASHTWPAQIRFRQLYVTVENSVWLQQLTFLKPTLLAKLRTDLGTEVLDDIALRVGPIPSRTKEPDRGFSDENRLPEVIVRSEAALHTAVIQDADLRERFTEVISKYPVPAPPRAKDPSRVP